MNHSGEITKISAALVSAQRQVSNALKNKVNPHLKNKYADLEAILDEVRPACLENGMALIQSPGMEGDLVTLITTLQHESGEWFEWFHQIPLPKADPQGFGSAVTYARRYSLSGIFSITQEDDDGEGAKKPTKEQPAAKPEAKKAEADAKAAKEAKLARFNALKVQLAKKNALIQDVTEEAALKRITELLATGFPPSDSGPDKAERMIGWLEAEIAK